MHIEYYQFILVLGLMFIFGAFGGAALWHQFAKYHLNKHK